MLNKQKVNEAWGDNPYRENWYALFAAIVTDKSVSRCLKEVCCVNAKDGVEEEYKPTISEEERKKFRIKQKRRIKPHKIKIVDCYENKEYEFDSKVEACEFLGIYSNNMNHYIKEKRNYKDRYMIIDLEEHKKDCEIKKVNVYDEVKRKHYKFNSKKAACEHMGCVHKTIDNYSKSKKLYRKRYRIQIVEENN